MLQLIFLIKQQKQISKPFHMLILQVFHENQTEIDKLDIAKIVPVSADLRKLNDVIKNDLVKKKLHMVN